MFPFTYDGKVYQNCTEDKHNRPWCSLTANYEGKWDSCKGIHCVFCIDNLIGKIVLNFCFNSVLSDNQALESNALYCYLGNREYSQLKIKPLYSLDC